MSSKTCAALPVSVNTDPTLAKGQLCFPYIIMRKLILSLPCFSFLGGHHIPGSHIPSIHRSALWRPPVNLGQASAGTGDHVSTLRKSQNNYKLLARAVWGRVGACTPQISMWGVWKWMAQRFVSHMRLNYFNNYWMDYSAINNYWLFLKHSCSQDYIVQWFLWSALKKIQLWSNNLTILN